MEKTRLSQGVRRTQARSLVAPATTAEHHIRLLQKSRRIFLAARFLTILYYLVIFPLSFVAKLVIDRAQWQTPMLNPSIWVACRSGFDVYFILRCGRRSHALVLIIYDGILAAGLAVLTGFLVHFTLGDLAGTTAGANIATTGVAIATLFFMFGDLRVPDNAMMNVSSRWKHH
jgi:hypothetical protein